MGIDTFEFVCITCEDSGLDEDIWLTCCHKVCARPYLFVWRKRWKKMYLFESRGSMPDKLEKWIKQNIVVLIMHWEGMLTDKGMFEYLTRVDQ